MINHSEISTSDLRAKIRKKEICYAGNRKLSIYGLLNCTSGKRMKRENRVFFVSEEEALQHHYRPCGKCMKDNYKTWKNGFI